MMLQNFNTNTSGILQRITTTSLALRPSGHREYLDRDFFFRSFIFNGKLSVEQIWQTAANVDKIEDDASQF
jgi:hypothetical protein